MGLSWLRQPWAQHALLPAVENHDRIETQTKTQKNMGRDIRGVEVAGPTPPAIQPSGWVAPALQTELATVETGITQDAATRSTACLAGMRLGVAMAHKVGRGSKSCRVIR